MADFTQSIILSHPQDFWTMDSDSQYSNASVVVEKIHNGDHKYSPKPEHATPPTPPDSHTMEQSDNSGDKGIDLRMEDVSTDDTHPSKCTSPSREVDDARLRENSREQPSSPTNSVELTNGDRGEVSLGLSNLPLFTCNQCDFTSNSAHLLHQHMRMHVGDRPHKCHICGFAFSQRGNLTRHVKTHSDERPHRCPLCSYRARRRDALVSHLQTHKHNRNHICIWCGSAYKQRVTLREHLKKCAFRKQVGAVQNEIQDVDVVYYDGALVVPEDMSGVQILDNSLSPEAGTEHEEVDKESRKRKNVITGLNPEGDQILKLSEEPEIVERTLADGVIENGIAEDTLDKSKDNQAEGDGLESTFTSVMQMYGHSTEDLSLSKQPRITEPTPLTPTITAVYSQAALETQSSAKSQLSPVDTGKDPEHSKQVYGRTIDLNRTRDFLNRSSTFLHTNSVRGGAHDAHEDMSDSTSTHSEQEPNHLPNQHKSPGSGKRPSKGYDHPESERSSMVSADSESSLARRDLKRSYNGEESSQLCAKCNGHGPPQTSSYKCDHCLIIFLDHVMYTIHMGCHGFRDPFECNICGQRCRDRYEFASHLARGKHL
ncbi:uncharacterized protein [Amphiura filiformis]|uniref:uncharacterized protein isoform X2 n=1 Tax=Amphiura filiformis TaxID=82378 RepID=UPI003B211644